MENLIRVSGIRKHYKDFTLRDVSFTLPQGSIMGFIGENGAGKTTTIKLMLNLIRRDGGEITLFGQDNIAQEAQVKERIGVLLDDNGFHEMLTAGDVSRIMAGIYRGWDHRYYTELLDRFEIPLKKKTVKEYSKGMKKKLGLAAALAHHPNLLIFDEPTSGLDPVVRGEILDILLEFIQNEQNGVLLSSHITSDLERIADYITFLHAGEVVFSEARDRLSERYGLLHATAADAGRLTGPEVIGRRKNAFGTEVLVSDRAAVGVRCPDLAIEAASLEEIMQFYVRRDEA